VRDDVVNNYNYSTVPYVTLGLLLDRFFIFI